MTCAYFRPDHCLVERLGESSGGDQSAMHSNALKEHKKNEGMIEDKPKIQKGIFRSWKAVDELGMGETFASPAPLGVVDEFRKLILSDDADYIAVYLTGLRLSHYNFLLTDYSYFQFSYSNIDCVRY